MNDTNAFAARLARVEAVIRAGRRLQDAGDELGQAARRRLLEVSGLSAAGVDLALSHHLETHPTREQLKALVNGYQPAEVCYVVLSANVCTAPLRALACALAVAPRVRLKPSRRDPVVAELLVEALRDEPRCEVTLVTEVSATGGEVVHAYGADETMTALHASLDPAVLFVGHGSGLGVAVISDEALAPAAEVLACDVVPFDGRGCLSPRLALVSSYGEVSAVSRATAFANLLHEALTRAGELVAAGPLSQAEQVEHAHYHQLMAAIGVCQRGDHHLVACDVAPQTITLPPPGRALLVLPCDAAGVGALLRPRFRYLTVLGRDVASPLLQALAAACPGARQVALGSMQRPPLDGPVDRR